MKENKAYMILKGDTVINLVYGVKPEMKGFEVIEITKETYVSLFLSYNLIGE